jgi:hypothetical protein
MRGFVVVMSACKHCSVSSRISIHKKAISSMEWQPNALQIAVASLDGAISIIALRESQLVLLHVLKAHSQPVACVRWSPLQSELVASASHDSTVQVWNAVQGTPISNIRAYQSRALSLCFSTRRADTMFIGGEDQMAIQIVGLSSDHLLPPKLKSKPKAAKREQPQIQKPQPQPQPQFQPQQSQRKTLIKQGFENQTRAVALESLLEFSQSLRDGARTSVLHGAEGVRNTIRSLALESQDCSLKSTLSLLSNSSSSTLVSILHEAEQAASLNSHHVALAASGGRELWRRTALAFARQLQLHGDALKATELYCACGEPREAIACCLSGKLFGEALVIAQTHFLGSIATDAATEIQRAWARYLESIPKFEQAAQCYLAAGDAEHAVALLQRRGDSVALEAALRISRDLNLDCEQRIAIALMHRCCCEQLWTKALDAAQSESLRVYLVPIVVERAVLRLNSNQIQLALPNALPPSICSLLKLYGASCIASLFGQILIEWSELGAAWLDFRVDSVELRNDDRLLHRAAVSLAAALAALARSERECYERLVLDCCDSLFACGHSALPSVVLTIVPCAASAFCTFDEHAQHAAELHAFVVLSQHARHNELFDETLPESLEQTPSVFWQCIGVLHKMIWRDQSAFAAQCRRVVSECCIVDEIPEQFAEFVNVRVMLEGLAMRMSLLVEK